MNHYQVLGISRTATPREISKIYREFVQIYHPDRMIGMPEGVIAPAQEKLKIINKAYSVLNRPHERIHYDMILKQQEFEEMNRKKRRMTGRLKLQLESRPVLNQRWGTLSSIWSSFLSFVTGKSKQLGIAIK
jgi:curved DNA-binding protein CbpA